MFLNLRNVAGSFPLRLSLGPTSKTHSSKIVGVFASFLCYKTIHTSGIFFGNFRPINGPLVAEKYPVDQFFVLKSVSLNANMGVLKTKIKLNFRISEDVGLMICVRFI